MLQKFTTFNCDSPQSSFSKRHLKSRSKSIARQLQLHNGVKIFMKSYSILNALLHKSSYERDKAHLICV